MNKNNLSQIFQKYIDRFDYLNNDLHQEYFKWQVCYKFPDLMKKALSSNDSEFSKVLNEARKCTDIIIDGYTQPFSGLVEFAKHDPNAVRKLLIDLYSDDGGNIIVQMQKIEEFFAKSNELLEKYFPGSFLYKQNSHSVSSMLFLNDPDHHYMYKAMQSKRFADCVEFYDDWGTGDNIKLDIYYRMCDELVHEILNCKELIDTDKSRFDGRLSLSGGELHPDVNKHILAFDIIYCCSTYDLFDGISYTKRNLKEKQLYLQGKTKAEGLKKLYDKANEERKALDEILCFILDSIAVGDVVKHVKNGNGNVVSIDEKSIEVEFIDKTMKFGLALSIANKILTIEKDGFSEKIAEYKEILKRYDKIPASIQAAANALKPYEEYLD